MSVRPFGGRRYSPTLFKLHISNDSRTIYYLATFWLQSPSSPLYLRKQQAELVRLSGLGGFLSNTLPLAASQPSASAWGCGYRLPGHFHLNFRTLVGGAWTDITEYTHTHVTQLKLPPWRANFLAGTASWMCKYLVYVAVALSYSLKPRSHQPSNPHQNPPSKSESSEIWIRFAQPTYMH
jgi:hypothetical protein